MPYSVAIPLYECGNKEFQHETYRTIEKYIACYNVSYFDGLTEVQIRV